MAEEVRAKGGEAMSRALDVADPAAIETLVDWADHNAAPFDVLVNNAGIRDRSPNLFAIDVAEWDEVFAVNVRDCSF